MTYAKRRRNPAHKDIIPIKPNRVKRRGGFAWARSLWAGTGHWTLV